MPKEIERKFLVKTNDYKELTKGVLYKQAYLSTQKNKTVRVRTVGEKGFLTVKSISSGSTRSEYEYEIPHKHAVEMINELCEKPVIIKTRYKVEYEGFIWDVDEFHGENQGLVLAEIELMSEAQEFLKPDWLGDEVTGNPSYFNSSLVKKPYTEW